MSTPSNAQPTAPEPIDRDAVAKMGTSPSNALDLVVPIKTRPMEKIWVKSAFLAKPDDDEDLDCNFSPGMVLDQEPLNVENPTCFPDHKMFGNIISNSCEAWLFPDAPLTSAFARGWDRLPDELRVNVLSFNLVDTEPIQPYRVYDKESYPPTNRLRHHLRIGGRIAELAKETYYTKNVFYTVPWLKSLANGKRKMFIPSPPTLTIQLLRRLHLRLYFDEVFWQDVIRIADKTFFPNLVELVVLIGDFRLRKSMMSWIASLKETCSRGKTDVSVGNICNSTTIVWQSLNSVCNARHTSGRC